MRQIVKQARFSQAVLWPALLVSVLGLASCGFGLSQAPQSSGSLPTSSQATTTSTQAVQQDIRAIGGTTQVDPANNQIRYTTQDVTLVAVGAPPGREGEYWQVDGRVNPTVIVPAGARMIVEVINGDPDMPHGWLLTTNAPPYGRMPMMGGMYGGMGMYAVVAPLPATQGGSAWPMSTLNFVAPPAGTYYYICQVQDHAQEGMWGKLIVE